MALGKTVRSGSRLGRFSSEKVSVTHFVKDCVDPKRRYAHASIEPRFLSRLGISTGFLLLDKNRLQSCQIILDMLNKAKGDEMYLSGLAQGQVGGSWKPYI